MRNFLTYALVGTLLAGSMLGLLLSDDAFAGIIQGLFLGLGVWLTIVGWAFFRSSSA